MRHLKIVSPTLKAEVEVYLEKEGFVANSEGYYRKQAPGHLGVWTGVGVDIRFFSVEGFVIIRGFRGSETHILCEGTVKSLEEFELILEIVHAI